MSDLPIKIKVGPVGKGARVEIDGKDMSSHIRGFAIQADVNGVTAVQLDFVKVEVELDAVVDLTALGNEWATYRLGQVLRDEMQRETQA